MKSIGSSEIDQELEEEIFQYLKANLYPPEHLKMQNKREIDFSDNVILNIIEYAGFHETIGKFLRLNKAWFLRLYEIFESIAKPLDQKIKDAWADKNGIFELLE